METGQHLVQVAIDAIFWEGGTPRIQVDATREGVVVPQHVSARWGKKLVLDLDASWPLNLEYDEAGVHVDLAFAGSVMRCLLPYEAIYVVVDRQTGRGSYFPEWAPDPDAGDVPMRPSRRPGALAEARIDDYANESDLPRLKSVPPLKSSPPAKPALKSPPSKPALKSVPPVAPEGNEGDASTPSSQSAEDEAKKRRASFRVIDGGDEG